MNFSSFELSVKELWGCQVFVYSCILYLKFVFFTNIVMQYKIMKRFTKMKERFTVMFEEWWVTIIVKYWIPKAVAYKLSHGSKNIWYTQEIQFEIKTMKRDIDLFYRFGIERLARSDSKSSKRNTFKAATTISAEAIYKSNYWASLWEARALHAPNNVRDATRHWENQLQLKLHRDSLERQ